MNGVIHVILECAVMAGVLTALELLAERLAR